MGEEMSLRALGEIYAREAEVLEELITACGERRRFAVKNGRSKEAQRQERLQHLHMQQRNDLWQLSAWLRNYYGAQEDTAGTTEGEGHYENDRSHIA
ncbi:MAG: hypothetical protein LBQ33_02615 [Oscillospiraceae bacterium]|jgi:hypothetical protein|nr:hypothetical protein [Oscillospiraceae bacterium]